MKSPPTKRGSQAGFNNFFFQAITATITQLLSVFSKYFFMNIRKTIGLLSVIGLSTVTLAACSESEEDRLYNAVAKITCLSQELDLDNNLDQYEKRYNEILEEEGFDSEEEYFEAVFEAAEDIEEDEDKLAKLVEEGCGLTEEDFDDSDDSTDDEEENQ